MSESELLAAALAYAARGWHVFPLRPGDKRPAAPDHAADRCDGSDPRCRAAGRHVTWEERATTNPDRITRAWSARPYGIGIACGPSGLVVVDLDVPKPGATPPAEWQKLGIVDGTDVFADLASRHGFDAHPDTFTATTPSGGTHLYYTHPAGTGWDGTRLGNTAGTLGWCVDTRAHGGYVAAPPTTLHDGHVYTVANPAEAIPLPAALAHALRSAPRPAPGSVTVNLPPTGSARRDAYLNAALRNQLDHVATAPEGTRNRALYTSAVALGQLVAGGELDPDHVRAALTTAAQAAGLKQAEISRTITSGMAAGTTRPRTLTHTSREAA
jgi:hypothetical protein